jgi:hypothetical protein
MCLPAEGAGLANKLDTSLEETARPTLVFEMLRVKGPNMNRIELPKVHSNKRRQRAEVPAQLELTLPMPRGHEPQKEPESEAEGPQTERGSAVVDFYI